MTEFSLRARTKLSAAIIVVSAAMIASPAFAVGTTAGTKIENTADISYDNPVPGGTPITGTSNTVVMTVDELLDVKVVNTDPSNIIVAPGQTGQVTTFTVTNTGNGPEAYTLTTTQGTSDNFDTTVTGIFIDSNGDGVYTPGTDLAYNPASPPVIAADASITVFVVATIPTTATDDQESDVILTATATTASGTPGTSVAGAGEGGGAAVVGASGATGNDEGTYEISAAVVKLVKTAVVLDPWGGTTLVPGSVVTYTLAVESTGSRVTNNVVVTDVVPAGLVYNPGSITLRGTGKTDAVDGDEGVYDSGANSITVTIPTVAGGTTAPVTFKATVKPN